MSDQHDVEQVEVAPEDDALESITEQSKVSAGGLRTLVLKRKKTLRKLVKENMKVTEWLQSKKREHEPEEIKIVEMMDVDAPKLVDTDKIERKEAARIRNIKWKNKCEVSNIVKELVDSVVTRSTVERVLISRSTQRIKNNKVWSLFEDGPLLQEVVNTKMR